MSFDADEEILQDFLVEAGEILEKLSEQLVDLENNVDDKDLLNAIFRGFHTVKGGAGFLQLDPLVELCHIAENVFDDLRNGKLLVNSEIMDVVLQALDAVNSMFSDVSNRSMPDPADRELLASLEAIVKGELPAAAPEPQVEPSPEESQAAADAQPAMIEPESAPQAGAELFEPAAPVEGTANPPAESEGSTTVGDFEEISENEFEALLDELHGVGGAPGKKESGAGATTAQQASSGSGADVTPSDPAKLAEIVNSTEDEITDEEFESLLDALHGAVKSPSSSTPASVPAAVPPKAEPASQAAAVAPPSAVSTSGSVSSAAQAAVKAELPETPPQPAQANKAAAASVTPAAKRAAPAKPKGPTKEPAIAAETTVRVDTQRLDEIMNMVGELVLVRNRLVRLGLKSTNEAMAKAVANLDVVTADLQTSVMKTRMQPIKKVFGRFPRVVRDLARNLKKEVNLELRGEETDLDKNLVEALADPLVHLVRNAVDHGIEKPDDREAKGKLRTGKVILSAEQEGDHIVLSISDDGGGMDADVLREKAVSKGLMDQDSAERLTDFEAYNLIFAPGFSTRDEISDVSGRGVGMDVVKTKITQLNGTIDVQSEKGKGSVIAIQVPLTLAIMPTLMVMLGKQTFALPLVNVNEIFHLDLSRTNEVDGQEVVIVREKALPLFHLKRWLVDDIAMPAEGERQEGHVVIVSVGTQKVGFVVDQLIGQEEVVIKPLGKMLHGTAGMAGATITGDGRIALILDIPSMLKRYAGRL